MGDQVLRIIVESITERPTLMTFLVRSCTLTLITANASAFDIVIRRIEGNAAAADVSRTTGSAIALLIATFAPIERQMAEARNANTKVAALLLEFL
jgi:hypothetical protein